MRRAYVERDLFRDIALMAQVQNRGRGGKNTFYEDKGKKIGER